MICSSPKKTPNGIYCPCGHCLACRQANSNQWIARFMCEEDAFRRGAFFGTLTYNKEALPKNSDLDEKAVALYWKRVKKELQLYNCGFVYTYCGEYGTKKGRPHYHFVAAGFSIDEVASVEQIKTFKRILTEQWQKFMHGSFVYISEIYNAEASIRYLINYTTKTYGYWALKDGETREEFTKRTGRVAPFVRFSHGISKNYFEQHKEELKTLTHLQFGEHKFVMPRYFRKKLDLVRNSDDYANAMDEVQKYYSDALLKKYKVKSSFDLPLDVSSALFDLEAFPIYELADLLPQWKNYIYSRSKIRARRRQYWRKKLWLFYWSFFDVYLRGYLTDDWLRVLLRRNVKDIIAGILLRDADYQSDVRNLEYVWFDVPWDCEFSEWFDIDKSASELKELLDRWNDCVCRCQRFFLAEFRQAGLNRRAEVQFSHLKRALTSKKRGIEHD